MIEELKRLANRISANFSDFRHWYVSTLNSATKVMEIENEMAKLSSYTFVSAFRPVAKSMAEMLPYPNTESYIRFANEAIEMLERREDQAEVLWHFDILLEKMKRGER